MSSIKLTADSGGGTVELKAPASTGSNANKQFILPQNDGTANQALVTDASGNLSFAAKGKVLKVQQSLISSISDFAAASDTYQTISEPTFVVAGTNTNLLILDEIFDSSLDGQGTDDFFKIIKTLEKENIFIISHKGDILFDKFTNIIKYEKVQNFTQLGTI